MSTTTENVVPLAVSGVPASGTTPTSDEADLPDLDLCVAVALGTWWDAGGDDERDYHQVVADAVTDHIAEAIVQPLLEQLHSAKRDARWEKRNSALYRRLVAGREQERDRHRRAVADLEARIDKLQSALADALGSFTDHDRPDCGSPRARSRWVDSRTLRRWRDQLVQAEPDEQHGAAT